MEIIAAQADMRRAYTGGVPGVFVSGLVWLGAGLADAGAAFAVLFIGGMFIFPASLAVSRVVFKAPPVSKANLLNRLAMESTLVLFAGLAVAYMTLPVSAPRAFALFAVIMGARYFTFATVYGEAGYWLLGGSIMAVGAFHAFGHGLGPVGILTWVGMIEVIFAAVLMVRLRRMRMGVVG